MKICPICKNEKPKSEFNHQKNGKISGYCKICNKIKCKEYSLLRKQNDPNFLENEKIRSRTNRQEKLEYRIGQMINSMKNSSKKRGITFNINSSFIYIMMLQQNRKCIKTGIDFDFTAGKGKQPFGPTIDRINSSKGYEPGNVQLVCNLYNYAKNEWSDSTVLYFSECLVAEARKLIIT